MMPQNDWESLQFLRDRFLSDERVLPKSYWQSEEELSLYDRWFGQRITWKWDAVLEELKIREWRPPPEASILDWACGSGVAIRAYLRFFGEEKVRKAFVSDPSREAIRFSLDRLKEEFPKVSVSELKAKPSQCDVILLSHVLGHLGAAELESLLRTLENFTSILWVEPGLKDTSRKLIEIRERLKGIFYCIAPCTHGKSCGLLAEGNHRHWCHHFAPSPSHIFQDSKWALFSKRLKVDLRSLPVSFLVLDKREGFSPLPGRIIGKPRKYRGYSQMLYCSADGVTEKKLLKKVDKELLNSIDKEKFSYFL